MALSSIQRFDLKKFIKELLKHRGRHTELVSVYIPAGYDIIKIIQHLAQEQGTASNIKSTSTRKNVQDALERMIQHLRLYKQTPANGLAAFSGNVAEKEGQSDVKVWSIEPPIPLNIRIYRCDKEFVTDILQDMLDVKEVYGLVVLDKRDADIAYLRGKTIVPLMSTHSHVPGKFKAGGQSALRFSRLREIAAREHFKKVGDYVKDQFFENKQLKGIIVGGPGPTKYEFVDGDYLPTELKNKVIGIKDLSYTGDFGLQELLEKSEDILAKEEVIAEKQIMQKFFDTLHKNMNKISYGEADTWAKLEMGAVEVLLLSDTIDDEKLEKFEEKAQEFNTEVRIISTDTREGAQLRDMGKFASILRYEIYT